MKILAVCPNATDATAFYRVLMPMKNLKKTKHITYEIANNPSDEQINDCDIVLLQRPCVEIHLKMAQKAKEFNKPLVVDYDDNLFEVPNHNPAHYLYSRKDVQDIMSKCITLADHIMVSTLSLKEALLHLNANISVVPNALDLSNMPTRTVSWDKRHTNIVWRGTNTHQADIASVATEIAMLSKKHSNWKWMFMGVDYKILEAFMTSNTYSFAGAYPDIQIYYTKLQQIAAPIHVVPLEDNKFNHSKSNIAWLEATWAGSAVVAPDMLEWKCDGIKVYSSVTKFSTVVHHLLSNLQYIKIMNEASWKLIKSEYLIEHTNQKRLEIFRKLLA